MPVGRSSQHPVGPRASRHRHSIGVSARDHISRAVADKIRETQSLDDLKKVAEEVLPEIEKFLESPAEKRLRRIRMGVVFAAWAWEER